MSRADTCPKCGNDCDDLSHTGGPKRMVNARSNQETVCPCGKSYSRLSYEEDVKHMPHRVKSNQETIGNGCVCEHGCDSCTRLAEAWEAMREALQEAWKAGEGLAEGAAIRARLGVGEWEAFLLPFAIKARAALALADRVRRADG